jgi:hypothetical protein
LPARQGHLTVARRAAPPAAAIVRTAGSWYYRAMLGASKLVLPMAIALTACDFGNDDSVGDAPCKCGSSYAACSGNLVIDWAGGDEFVCTGTCAYTSVTCRDGCDLEWRTEYLGEAAPLAMFCRETPTAMPGDPCSPLGCRPTRAREQPDGSAVQDYLTCDNTTRQCVPGKPPVVTDYLAPCDDWAIEHGGPDRSGVANHCLIAWDPDAELSRHGRTIGCIGDWECPQGSSCDDRLENLQFGWTHPPVCRPGPRGAPLVDHLPPPP